MEATNKSNGLSQSAIESLYYNLMKPPEMKWEMPTLLSAQSDIKLLVKSGPDVRSIAYYDSMFTYKTSLRRIGRVFEDW